MDVRQIELIVKHIKEGYYDNSDRMSDVVAPLMEAFGDDLGEILEYPESWEEEDVEALAEVFDYLIGEFADDPRTEQLEQLQNNIG